MRRVQLIEFRTEPAVKLTALERDSLRRLYPGIRIEPTVGGDGLYDVTADESIGIICLPAVTIEIRPKVPISSVFSFPTVAMRPAGQSKWLSSQKSRILLNPWRSCSLGWSCTRPGMDS